MRTPIDAPAFPKLGPRHCSLTGNPDLFFGEMDKPGTRESWKMVEEAKEICFGCPYLDFCGKWAMDHEDERGVWGALSEQDRREIRRGEAPVPIFAVEA